MIVAPLLPSGADAASPAALLLALTTVLATLELAGGAGGASRSGRLRRWTLSGLLFAGGLWAAGLLAQAAEMPGAELASDPVQLFAGLVAALLLGAAGSALAALRARPAQVAGILLGTLAIVAALLSPLQGRLSPAALPGIWPSLALCLVASALAAGLLLGLADWSQRRRWRLLPLVLVTALLLALAQRCAAAALAGSTMPAGEAEALLPRDLLALGVGGLLLLVELLILAQTAFARRLGAALSREAAAQRAVRDELELRVATRTRELERAKDRAEAANRAKSEFLSSMSHELRTPLNSIMGFAQLTLYNAKREPVTQRQSRALENIRRSGQLLLQLIDDVLDLSRIEAGNIALSLEEVEVPPLFEELRATLQPLADRHAVKLIVRPPEELPPVRGDRTRLLQVLVNLGSNAIKYNRPEGKVTIEAASDGQQVLCRVTDTGRGIPRERWEDIFKPFNRVGAEHSAIEGTGIGLTIVRRLVELMEGEIRFDSVVDEGSRFEVLLAAGDGTLASQATSLPPEIAVWRHPVGAFSLLYIEDNPSNIELMESLVESLPGVSFIPAQDPLLGLQLASRLHPQVIVLDINLPHLNGYEVLQRLRSDSRTADIPVIGLSASAMPKDVDRAKRAGFHDYLVKPLQVDRFMGLLNGLVSRAAE